VVYILISKNGALGELNLIFTPQAMMLAQIILCTPIITGLVGNAVENVEPAVIRTAMTLGADSKQVALTVLREQRYAIYAAIVTGFGRVIAEVGAVMLVGGNIRYSTRVMTTAIVLETRRGNYAFALSLGVILLLIAFIINILLSFFNRKGRAY
jgi:tungstate transport system permease protein